MEKNTSQPYKELDNFVVSNKRLGCGQYGLVLLGCFKDKIDKILAVKQIPKIYSNQQFMKILSIKKKILINVKSKHVVAIYNIKRIQRELYMFQEYCGDGNMKDLLKKRGGKITESEAVLYFWQIAQGFKALFDEGITHGNIEPQNILFKNGMAKISGVCDSYCDLINETTKNTYLITPLYMAPELLMEEDSPSKCDIWSLGMIFYQMLYGHTPWIGKTPYQLCKNIQQNPLEFDEKQRCSELAKDLLRKMLKINHNERITWSEIFKHPLFNQDLNFVHSEQYFIIQNKFTDEFAAQCRDYAFYLQCNKVASINKIQIQKAFKDISGQKNNYHNQQKQQHQEYQGTQVQQDSTEKTTLQQNAKVLYVDDKTQPHKEIKSRDTSVIDINQVFQAQNQVRATVQYIDSYFTFQRNRAIFFSFTANLIFLYLKKEDTILPEDLLYRVIFVLQKHQVMEFELLHNTMISQEKPDAKICSQEQWILYGESKQFKNTLWLIKNDQSYTNPYFNQIFVLTQNFLTNFPSDAKIQRFLKIFNNDTAQICNNFEAVYQETLQEFLEIVRERVTIKGACKFRLELMKIVMYVFTCRNLLANFQWKEMDNSVFYQFYDQYEHIDEMTIEKLVLAAYGEATEVPKQTEKRQFM